MVSTKPIQVLVLPECKQLSTSWQHGMASETGHDMALSERQKNTASFWREWILHQLLSGEIPTIMIINNNTNKTKIITIKIVAI